MGQVRYNDNNQMKGLGMNRKSILYSILKQNKYITAHILTAVYKEHGIDKTTFVGPMLRDLAKDGTLKLHQKSTKDERVWVVDDMKVN